MSRSRKKKMERKIKKLSRKDGGKDKGGKMKIYGEYMCSDVK